MSVRLGLFTSSEEHKFMVLRRIFVLVRENVNGRLEKVTSGEELHNQCSSPNIARVT
jgi:hypothetical protein